MTTSDEHTNGYAVGGTIGGTVGGTVGWISVGPWGPVIGTLGPDAARLVSTLYTAGLLEGTHWLHLPPGQEGALAPVPVQHMDDWEFRWLASDLPGNLRHEDAVEVLGEADVADVEALLEAAYPDTSSRPGKGGIRRWYGIRDATGTLVACGADRSRNGVGFLAAIAVANDRRGQGFGAAVTAAMARQMAAEFDAVALGVTVENHHAIALYQRLGFTGTLRRVSYEIAD
jgi:ribosomal protein S18 acetylase RimI-like enzyme